MDALTVIRGNSAAFRLADEDGDLSAYTIRASVLNSECRSISSVLTQGDGIDTVDDGARLITLSSEHTGGLYPGERAQLVFELVAEGGTELETAVALNVKPNLIP